MAEILKSALLLDYESLDRSLFGADGKGTRLADRAAAWVAAIETGRLIGPDGTKRRLVSKRCYAGPTVLGKQRDALTAAGFEVVDLGGGDAMRTSAELHIAMDTIEALGKPGGPDEFIVLTSGSELSPLLTRLKASKRQATVFADASLSSKERALADAVLDQKAFAAFLASDETPVAEGTAASGASFRAEIEAFARRIHAATNIPLFSPKTYAELFKHLTDEIRENGYHFQTTAKNVADRMTKTGRNVTRRQVVFIVKGLALKGHVFSTNDTPDALAEVFREQARYLITNAGIAIDPGQERLLSAWFVSNAAPAPATKTAAAANVAAPKPTPAPAVPQQPAKTASAPAPAPVPEEDDVDVEDIEVIEDIEDEVEEPVVAAPPPPPPPQPAQPKPQPARPTASAKPPQPPARPPQQVKPVDLPKSAAKPAVAQPQPTKPPPLPLAREEAKAVIAARIAASAKMKPGARPGNAKGPTPRPAPVPAAQATRPNKLLAADAAADALESSILAAIAEAVDVLVEDSTESAPAPAQQPQPARAEVAPQPQQQQQRPRGNPAPAAKPQQQPTPQPQPASAFDDDDSGDIGDQIQRIIASYNRNREDG